MPQGDYGALLQTLFVKPSVVRYFAVMHMVSVHIPVLIFLAVFVLAFSGFGLLVIKVLAIVLHPVTQGPIVGSIANVLDALNQALSPMVYFKIAVPVFFCGGPCITVWLG
nr:uncharacterized protein [Enterobacter cloacae subsp. cloacae]